MTLIAAIAGTFTIVILGVLTLIVIAEIKYREIEEDVSPNQRVL
jgi:hypothetical protein